LEKGLEKNNMIASLPMYDSYIPRTSTAKLWAEVIVGYNENKNDDTTAEPPQTLDHNISCHSAWSAGPALFLSQTCGRQPLKPYQVHLPACVTEIISLFVKSHNFHWYIQVTPLSKLIKTNSLL
jgi:hypothetical protein